MLSVLEPIKIKKNLQNKIKMQDRLQNKLEGAREMTPWWRALVALPEDLG